jgi:hypothetical protein
MDYIERIWWTLPIKFVSSTKGAIICDNAEGYGFYELFLKYKF